MILVVEEAADVVVLVPFRAMAKAWKAENEWGLGSAGGLMAKTIPGEEVFGSKPLLETRTI